MLRVSGPTATVSCDGAVYEARIPPRLPGGPVVVGDEVVWRESGDERVITAIVPRRTLLQRAQGIDGPRRPIAANAAHAASAPRPAAWANHGGLSLVAQAG